MSLLIRFFIFLEVYKFPDRRRDFVLARHGYVQRSLPLAICLLFLEFRSCFSLRCAFVHSSCSCSFGLGPLKGALHLRHILLTPLHQLGHLLLLIPQGCLAFFGLFARALRSFEVRGFGLVRAQRLIKLLLLYLEACEVHVFATLKQSQSKN